MGLSNSCTEKLTRLILFFVIVFISNVNLYADEQQPVSNTKIQTIKALYIPLADHYAALVAYERYRE